MTERPGIQVLADLPHELSFGIELEQLRSRRRVGRARGVAARQDEDVPLRVHRDAGDFAEIQVLRQLERVGPVERNLRHRVLRRYGRREQHQAEKQAFHDILLERVLRRGAPGTPPLATGEYNGRPVSAAAANWTKLASVAPCRSAGPGEASIQFLTSGEFLCQPEK